MQLWTKIYIFFHLFLLVAEAASPSRAKTDLVEAGRIAKQIQHIHPNISYDRALTYGKGILAASRKYGVDSTLLVSIAHQESGFRENLKEGAAGELGICQIRKIWVHNEKLQKDFGYMKEKDLLNPAKSFMVAAWILRDLKNSKEDGVIPYWAYYNSVKFHNRLKYYTLVNRYLSAIKTQKPVKPLRKVAALWYPEKKKENKVSPAWEAKHVLASADTSQNYWIPAALKKLQNQSERNGQRGADPKIVKAAFDLNVPNLFGSLPVID